MTYLVFALLIVAGTAAATVPTLRRLPWKPVALAAAVLMTLTAIFDNVLVGTGIVDYDDDLILGLRVPYAPIEDFSYTVAVVLLVPALWTWTARLAPRRDQARDGEAIGASADAGSAAGARASGHAENAGGEAS